MEMVKLIIFVFSTLILPPDQVSSQPRVSKCLQSPPDPNVSMTSTHGMWCYFVTNGSMNDTNEDLELNFVYFKITKAQKICAAEGATLLIIKNEQENKHVIQHYHKVAESLVLGLKQFLGESGYVYKWDDGSNVTFKPPKWDDQDMETDITVLESGGGWKNTKAIGRHPVGVVCQQPLHQPSRYFAATTVSQIVCDFQDTTQFEIAKVFEYGNTKACFFIPNGSDEAANTGIGSLYIFNISAAREICTQHNATLPSIHSIEEENFLENYISLRNYSLGLQQLSVPGGGFEYKWEDGTDFDYQPVWLSKYQLSNYIVSKISNTGGVTRPREWHNVHDQEASIIQVRVICKQLYPSKPKPPVKNISNCDDIHKVNFAMTGVYQNQTCYFMINGATNMSNEFRMRRGMDPKPENVYFHFKPSIARELCQREAATLPTISSEEEEKFIMQNFNHSLFTAKIGPITYTAESIMLDLKQVKRFNDYQWADNTPFSYQHPNWANKDEYAYHTVMYLQKSEWENRNSSIIWSKPIGVICKKPHFQEPNETSTPEADTTKPAPTTITSSPTTPITLFTLCDLGNTTDIEIVGIFKDGNPQACYFTVNGSIEEANKEQNGTYIFNITVARDICKRHNATLPSVQSIAEERFMLPYNKFPLGLKQVQVPGGYEYEWDDGSKFDYQPEWLTKYQPANYTISANMHLDVKCRLRKWHNAFDQETFNESIPVICKQSYPPTVTPTPTPPAGKYVSNCNDEWKNSFAKTSIYGDQCYFLISDATNMANELKRDQTGNFEYYIFYPSIAREICQNESATLPTITNMHEHLFILNNFGHYTVGTDLFRMDGTNSSIMAIMLDLKQVTNVSDYRWTDGTPWKYDALRWYYSKEYAFFTTASLVETDWINMNSAVNNDTPIGVLCKQPHLLTTTSEPTTSTTTTSSAPTTTQPPVRTVCDDNEDTAHFKIVRMFEDKACYFIVKGSEEAANTQQNGTGLYFFNITAARDKCAEYKGTLPSIHSDNEDDFLRSQIIANNFYSLGLQQVAVDGGYEYKWDDGSKFEYEAHWMTKYHPANYTISFFNNDNLTEWFNLYDQVAFQTPIAVLCKQSYPSKSEPPPIRKISSCNHDQKHKYTKTEIFNGTWCYFVIKGATSAANKLQYHTIVKGRKYYIFSPSKAREICQKESATLPIIGSRDEHMFINTTFQPALFIRPNEIDDSYNPIWIMIDLKQGNHVNDYQWIDGTALTYHLSLDKWEARDQYAHYTVMYLRLNRFINIDDVQRVYPVGVLCKQKYFPETDILPTSTTEAIATEEPTAPPPETEETEEPVPPPPTPESPSSTQPPPTTSYFPEPKPEANKCLPENSRQYYEKVAKSGEISAISSFSPAMAKIHCQRHGGDLPILFDKEDEFILDNFFDSTSQSGVALALKGEVDETTGGIKVKWRDGAVLTYFNPDHWITEMGKIEYGFMYRTVDGGIEWKPGTAITIQDKPVGVVCQQVIKSSGNRLIKPMVVFSVVMIFMMK